LCNINQANFVSHWGILMDNSKVSIIVPVYNVEQYLDDCIKSILNQSYQNIEIILVDDGSQDNSGAICDKYASLDTRINVIHKENSGVSDARNCGIHAATGKYIVFVDSDDTVDTDYVKILSDEILNSEFDCIICGYRTCYPKQKIDVCVESNISIYKIDENEKLITQIFNQRLLHSPCNKIYKKEYITEYFDPSIAMGEDLMFNLKYLRKIVNVKVISDVLYNYIIHPGSAVTTYKTKRMNDMIQMINSLISFYSDLFENQSCSNSIINYCLREIDGLYRHLFRGTNTKAERKEIIKYWSEGEAYREFCKKYTSENTIFLANYEKIYRYYNIKTWLERKIVKILR